MWCVQRRACPRPLHLNLFPTSPTPLINYHLDKGNIDGAIQDFISNLELDPENPDAHASLVKLTSSLGSLALPCRTSPEPQS